MKLQDSVIVITGASRGLGRALAERCAQEGAQLVLSSMPSRELDAVARTFSAFAVPADVTDEAQVQHLASTAVQRFGCIDGWMNNAGIWVAHAPIEQQDSRRVHRIMEVNFFGTFYGSRAALIQMKKQGKGTIMNTLSTSALEGRVGSSGYCASKYAAVGFTKSLRLEAKPFGIDVIGVYPGGMKTHLFDEQRPEQYETYMDPADVAARVIANLQSDHPEEELIVRNVKIDEK